MKARQFNQLASMSKKKRDPILVEGLTAIADNVISLANDIERCRPGEAFRSAEITRNVMREEAGKFLILMDIYRAPRKEQVLVSSQLKRATNHLAKLIYDQMADYSIADRDELVRAIDDHRRDLHLDGPNDVDWIFRNSLIDERERGLYVDLVEAEGDLLWWTPTTPTIIVGHPRLATLVAGIYECGLVSEKGFAALQDAWDGFDPTANSHCSDWAARTEAAIAAVEPASGFDEHTRGRAAFVIDRWPMPMVELPVDELKIDPADLAAARDAWLDAQYGDHA
jgi:AbiV family abortive infection protein